MKLLRILYVNRLTFSQREEFDIRIITAIVLLIILLTACSPETAPKETKPETKASKKEKTEENIIVTEDGAVTFTIINTRNAPKEDLKELKIKILEAYNIVVTKSIDTEYTPAKNINIHLLKGKKPSTGYKYDIKLYATNIDQYPIVHEMTHTILGYGENFSSTRGYFTQEGYATYMESKYGESTLMNYGFSTHKIVKLLLNRDKNLPLNKLITQGYDTRYFRPVMNDHGDQALQWMSYMHAGSFVTYLIEKYGMKEFEKIYNQADLPKKLKEVYGKSDQELENEWLAHIENTIKITDKEKEMVNNLENLEAIIDSIDEDLFEG